MPIRWKQSPKFKTIPFACEIKSDQRRKIYCKRSRKKRWKSLSFPSPLHTHPSSNLSLSPPVGSVRSAVVSNQFHCVQMPTKKIKSILLVWCAAQQMVENNLLRSRFELACMCCARRWSLLCHFHFLSRKNALTPIRTSERDFIEILLQINTYTCITPAKLKWRCDGWNKATPEWSPSCILSWWFGQSRTRNAECICPLFIGVCLRGGSVFVHSM